MLQTKLTAEPCGKLYATDASPDGAGGCAASITQEDWLTLCDLVEEEGEHVRLDWKGEEPRATCTMVVQLVPRFRCSSGPRCFSCQFSKGKHINLESLESLISLLRRIRREGFRARRASFTGGFTCGFRSRLGRTIQLTKIDFLLPKLGFWCFADHIALELLWVPTWANLEDALLGNKPASLPKVPRPSRQFMPARNWIHSASRCQPRRTGCDRLWPIRLWPKLVF